MLRAALLLASMVVANGAWADSAALDKVFEEYYERYLQLNPISATFIGDHRYDDRLPNSLSKAYRDEALQVDRQYLEAVRRFDPNTLSPQARLSREIFIYERETALERAKFADELLPINQMFSLPALMPVLGSATNAQPFATVADYEEFLARMDDYVVWSDQAIANMRDGIAKKIVQPRVVMQKVLPQLAALLVEDPARSLFHAPVENFPDTFSPAERQRLTQAYRKAIAERITPSYRRLHDFIRDDYLPHTRSSVAWTALPNGQAWYAFLVRVNTTTDYTPDYIHELGLREVARIRSEMEQVKRQVGFEGDLHAFFKHLQVDPKFYYSNPDDLIAGYQDVKRRIDAVLPKYFALFPKADYEVRPVEAFRAESAAGASYQSPSADGSRPGIFYVNTFNLKAQPKFGMETLSLHEAAPGHHFQIAIQQELTELPRFRRFGGDYTSYVEGWALYAESIGREMGLFTDPYQYYGRLSDEMLRAMRLVVDTGLHSRGWSREKAIEYMLDNSSLAASDVEAEVERYIANPGQALGYKVGQIRIGEIRRKAEKALGAKFDVRQFHTQVLNDGAVPLDVLEAKIDRWIAAQ